jgi:hypothetical protein
MLENAGVPIKFPNKFVVINGQQPCAFARFKNFKKAPVIVIAEAVASVVARKDLAIGRIENRDTVRI